MLFKRDTFNNVGGLTESYNYAMDWEFILKIGPFAKIYSIPEPIAKLRKHDGAKTAKPRWQVAKEISEIGRKYNGCFDINYWSYKLRTRVYFYPKNTATRILRSIIDFIFMIWSRKYGYLIISWPDEWES